MEVKYRLIKARGNRSQKSVAKEIGIHESTLSMYENGNRVPRDSIKVKLAQFYGMSVQELFF